MKSRMVLILSLTLFCGLTRHTPVQGADRVDNPSLVRHLPAGALGTVEVTGLAPILERIETSAALKDYLDSPLYDDARDKAPVRKALAGKAILEAQLGMDLWTFGRKFLGDRIVLGVYPPSGGKQPEGVLIVRVQDAADLSKLLEKLTPLISLAGDQISIGDEESGGKVIRFEDGNRAVVRDRWLVASKDRELLSQTLSNLTTAKDSGLESEATWKLMEQQMGTEHTVQVCVNLARISELHGKRLIPEKLDNPLISMLYGGLLESATHSPYLGMTLNVREDGFSLQSAVAGKAADLDDAHRSLVLDLAQPLVPLVPGVAGRLAFFSFSRNLVTWYKAREQLLEAKLQPDFDKFETGLATFLPGKDFAEDVLPLLTGRVAMVSAPQDYGYLDGKPGVQIPAVGLVIELAKPREGADILNLVAQTILTVTNLESAKQKRQPWVQASESYRDVQINFARYLERPKGNELATSYNFQPASALVGNRFIMSSSLGLCRSLVDVLSGEEQLEAVAVGTAGDRSGVPNFVQELSPAIAADLLEANASVIHAKNIQNGKTGEQSARELEGLCKLLRHLTAIRFDSVQYPDHMRLELHGGWK